MSDPATRPHDPRAATIRQCAILVGGLGTRLGALTASTPKPMLKVGGRPFLAWLLGELVRFGVCEIVLLTGHLSATLRDSLPDLVASLPRGIKIRVSEEPAQAGTGGALFHARDLLDDRFLLCNGDSLFDFNLARLLADAAGDPPDVVGRMVLRRLDDASRYGVVTVAGDRITAFSPSASAAGPGVINAGVYLFDSRVLDTVTATCSLEHDILPRLAAAGALRGTEATGFFIDIGVPEDFARAQTAVPEQLRRPALFLDRDGVINVDHGWVGTKARFEFIPGALAAITTATDRGWHVFVVTNQSGVARGHYDDAAVTTLHAWLGEQAHLAGGTIDDIRYCPYHPEGEVAAYRRVHDWRKPAPGMILDLLARWRLDPARCLLVGDQPSDLEAAAAAGIRGYRFDGGDLARFVAPLLAGAPLRTAD